MDLHGLISGPSPRSTGGGKAPAPGSAWHKPEGGARAFGEVVASSRSQRMAQGGPGDAGAGSGDPPDPKPGRLPAGMLETADSPANGLSAGVHPTLQAGEIVATAPDAVSPDTGSNMPPGASDEPISDPVDAFDLPETLALVEDFVGFGLPSLPDAEPQKIPSMPPVPAAGGQPAHPADSSARATPGIVFTTAPGSPGAPASPLPPGRVSLGRNADAANPLPRDAGGGAALVAGTPSPRSALADTAPPVSPSGAGGRESPAAQPGETGVTSPRMTGTAHAPGGDQAPASGTASPGPVPGSGSGSGSGIELMPTNDLPGRIRPGERGAQPASAALPVREAPPPPGDPSVGSGSGSIPALPELPSAAMRGTGSVVRDGVIQALGEPARIDLVASSAAMAQSPAGPVQTLVAGQPALAGGAEFARAIAPQIATAIGSGPGSGRIELRLDPPELGKVEIWLEITDQSLRATLAAERPATNELLRRHSEILLAQLRQAGFTGIDLQFAGNRAGDQGGALPGETPRPALVGDPDAPPHDDGADLPAGRVARRPTDRLDLRL